MGWGQISAMLAMGMILCIISLADGEEAQISTNSFLPWWACPLILFVLTFTLGIFAVLGGVGVGIGGVYVDKLYAFLSLLQALILLFAASGFLKVGH